MNAASSLLPAPRLSVVIPALNESAALPGLLAQLQIQQGLPLEVVVADGGSSDDTASLAAAGGARVVACRRGRGPQMNAGARAAHAPWLLFLHADSRLLQPDQLQQALTALQMERARAGGRPVAGHFAIRFRRSEPGHDRFYRFLEGKSRLNRPGTIHGDQGLLVAREDFRILGGFPEDLPVMEDEDFAARVFARGRWLLLPGELETSARRFESEGVAPRYTLMALMMGLHAAGLRTFLEEAPAAYVPQHEARLLDLRPQVALIRRLLRRAGPVHALGIALRAGRYLRSNAWQLAYWRDAATGGDRNLRAFDRYLAPWLANPVVDVLAALLAGAWFFLWLPLRLPPRPKK